LLDRLYAQKWVVYCKPPLFGAESVVQYFARYAYRVAISNNRIAAVEDGQVTIRYRERSDGGQVRSLTFEAEEFVRRFLLHILPDRFVKIRYYGIMSNRNRKEKLGICCRLLGLAVAEIPDPPREPWQALLKRVTGIDVLRCRHCGIGTMVLKIRLVPYARGGPS
jgi:hypothetical protein